MDGRRVHCGAETGVQRLIHVDVLCIGRRRDVIHAYGVVNRERPGSIAGGVEAVGGDHADESLGGVEHTRCLKCVDRAGQVNGLRLPGRAVVGGDLDEVMPSFARIRLPDDGLWACPGGARRRGDGDRGRGGAQRPLGQQGVGAVAADLDARRCRRIGDFQYEGRGRVGRDVPAVPARRLQGRGAAERARVPDDLITCAIQEDQSVRASRRGVEFTGFKLIPGIEFHVAGGWGDDAGRQQQRVGQRGLVERLRGGRETVP